MDANSTLCSQAVTHPSTNRARRCLTSVIGRELVCSTWYGRWLFCWVIFKQYDIQVHTLCSASCSSSTDEGSSDLLSSDCASIVNCAWHNILSRGAGKRLTVKKTGLKILIMGANDELPINRPFLKLPSPKEFDFDSATFGQQYRMFAGGNHVKMSLKISPLNT